MLALIVCEFECGIQCHGLDKGLDTIGVSMGRLDAMDNKV